MHVIPDDGYTLDASVNTITLASPYDTISKEQLVLILDLDTNDVIYDVHLKRDGITFSSGVITYSVDNNITDDTDDVRIVIDDTSGTTQAIGGYSTTLDALKTIEQAPLDQQVLDETLLNAVTATGASTDVYVLDKNYITIEVVASSVTTGGTIDIEGTSDQTNYGTIGVVDNSDTVSSSISISSDGTYYYDVKNASSVKYMRANLSSRTDGTYTVKIFGRA